MSEVNQNTPAFDAESTLSNKSNQNNSSDYWSSNQPQESEQTIETVSKSEAENNNSSLAPVCSSGAERDKYQSKLGTSESLTHKMNWQRVAHKLREYNRRLLKKVFRLEQELAEIDNKFNKYVEKSQNSDLLLAQQAEEIKKFQEKVTLLTQQLATSQQQADRQELLIQQISEKHELAQKQTAQLERECTLLQEQYHLQSFELATKEHESQELQIQLQQAQQDAQQREAELKKYQSAAAIRKEKATNHQKNYPHNRFIQPWSTASIPEPKIALPRNKQLPTKVKRSNSQTLDPVKTAAEIATWSASNKKGEKPQSAKSATTKKPQSLAAVDLPSFPRP